MTRILSDDSIEALRRDHERLRLTAERTLAQLRALQTMVANPPTGLRFSKNLLYLGPSTYYVAPGTTLDFPVAAANQTYTLQPLTNSGWTLSTTAETFVCRIPGTYDVRARAFIGVNDMAYGHLYLDQIGIANPIARNSLVPGTPDTTGWQIVPEVYVRRTFARGDEIHASFENDANRATPPGFGNPYVQAYTVDFLRIG